VIIYGRAVKPKYSHRPPLLEVVRPKTYRGRPFAETVQGRQRTRTVTFTRAGVPKNDPRGARYAAPGFVLYVHLAPTDAPTPRWDP
jgi:hypothetical protein